MGLFFGGIGSIFIIMAAVAVICRFCAESELINRTTARRIINTIVMTASVGFVYMCVMAYIRSCYVERVNIFNFSVLFEALDGTMIRLGAGETGAVAVGYVGACVFAYMLKLIICTECSERKSDEIIFAVFMLPFSFMLFSPTLISWICTAVAIALWIIIKRHGMPKNAGRILKKKMSPLAKFSALSAEIFLNACALYWFVSSAVG